MDCFNGEIVALEMRDNRKKELCIDTVRQLERIYPNLGSFNAGGKRNKRHFL